MGPHGKTFLGIMGSGNGIAHHVYGQFGLAALDEGGTVLGGLGASLEHRIKISSSFFSHEVQQQLAFPGDLTSLKNSRGVQTCKNSSIYRVMHLRSTGLGSVHF